MLKSFFEPVESKVDDKAVDCNRIAYRCEKIEHQLLPCVELIDINRIEPALSRGTSGVEESIDIGNAASNIQAERTDNGTADDEEICMVQQR